MGLQQSIVPSVVFHIVSEEADAQRLLDAAERTDFYVEECREDHANARARAGCVYKARGLLPEEVALFQALIDKGREMFPLRLQSELTLPLSLVGLDRSAEGGMPHTRPGHVICYPDVHQTPTIHTLLHEVWHVHQRDYAGWWQEVFRSMDWLPVSDPSFSLPLPLESHRRFNPDTLDTPLWCFQKTWIPVPVFRDVVQPKVGEVDIWFYHVSLKYHVKRLPRELAEQYSPSLPVSAYEHPRELAAYLLSEPDRYGECVAFSRLIEAVGGISCHRKK